MRERAEAATSGPWEFRPRRGFQSMGHDPATIGFTDEAGYFVMVREGTWATEADMGYMASWPPAVALAVADWLESAAGALSPPVPESALDVVDAGRMIAVADEGHALTVARAYLGEDA